MKKYLLPILLIGFWSCGDSEPVNPLEGTWQMESFSYTIYSTPLFTHTFDADVNTEHLWTLNDDGAYNRHGKVTLGSSTFSDSGTWSSGDELLTIIKDKSDRCYLPIDSILYEIRFDSVENWKYSMTDNDNWHCYLENPPYFFSNNGYDVFFHGDRLDFNFVRIEN